VRLAVAAGEIHHGRGHGHYPYAVTFGGEQFTESRVGTAAAKCHQYAVGHIELAREVATIVAVESTLERRSQPSPSLPAEPSARHRFCRTRPLRTNHRVNT
jgi:hypothetical protein